MRYLNLKDQKEYKYCYKIVDSEYLSDTKINGLEYLIQAHFQFKPVENTHLNFNFQSKNSFDKIIFNQITPIGDNQYPIQVSYNQGTYHVKIQKNSYQINKETIKADIEKIDITILMGPVFILQLAKNHVFCLHASAFIMEETCFIVMADSGTGKSTIARYIHQNQLGIRVADDIVPIKIIGEKVTLLPNFPQLKLLDDQQYKGENIQKKITVLFAQKSTNSTSMQKLGNFASIKKLIKHTVATKLFQENELNNHLKFCHLISQNTLAYQLNYQHSEQGLMQLMNLLDERV